MNHEKFRLWDLPTRVFHWALALAIVAAIVSGQLGGNLIDWIDNRSGPDNALGVQWVYLGTYPAIEAGPGLDTLVEGVLGSLAAHPQDEWWDFDIPAERYPARSLKRAFRWFKDNW